MACLGVVMTSGFFFLSLYFQQILGYSALRTGAAIVPMTIFGTEKLMSKGSMKIKGGRANLVFHAPISPANYQSRDELMAAVRAQIAEGLPPELR